MAKAHKKKSKVVLRVVYRIGVVILLKLQEFEWYIFKSLLIENQLTAALQT